MTDSEEWLLTCLARHVLNTYRTKEERRAWLAKWRKNHGEASEAKVKAAVQSEWSRSRSPGRQA